MKTPLPPPPSPPGHLKPIQPCRPLHLQLPSAPQPPVPFAVKPARPLQPRSAFPTSAGVRTKAPVRVGVDSYRIDAAAGGQVVGSVTLHAKGKAGLEITDLGVQRSHRGQGVGTALMASAVMKGAQLGRSNVTLAAQDSGSGRLTRWYTDMGFARVGVNHLGLTQLHAPIGRLVSTVSQQPS